MIRFRYILANKNGNGMPLAAAVTLALLLIFLVISQYVPLLVISAGVKDALQKAAISTINDNYADVYHAVREGYAAGYQPGGGGFEPSVNEGDIYGRLDDLLGLRTSGDYHYHAGGDGKTEYRLTGLSVAIDNNSLASGSRTGFTATVQIQLEVPITFLNKILPDMKILLHTKATYTPKF